MLGVHIDNHLSWTEHINRTLSSCYGSLAVLRKLRSLAPFAIRKQLAESLILSKLDYCDVVINPIPEYQTKRLQRVQNACTAFVIGKYARTKDVTSLGWLPIRERRKLNLLKLIHKALFSENWPNNLRLDLRTVNAYNLRSSVAPQLSVPGMKETDTFQHMAAQSFNSLPDYIRNITEYRRFIIETKKLLLHEAKTKLY